MKVFVFLRLVFIVVMITAACGRKSVPKEVLDRGKMEKVLFEIAMADGYLENFVFRDSTINRDSAVKIEFEKVLKVHKVSQELFRHSYDYYKANPAILKQMVDSVYQQSQRNQEKLYARPRPGKFLNMRDTIKSIPNVSQ